MPFSASGLELDQGSDVIKNDGLIPVTITGHITDNSGKLASSGWVEFRLQPESQALPYSVLPGLVIANPTRGHIVAGGRVVQHPGGVKPLLIWPNDLIIPANSLYQITIAPHGRVSRVYNGVLITQNVNPQNLASLTFVSPQDQVVGNVVEGNPLVTMSLVPAVDSAFVIGDALHRYAAGWFNQLNVQNLNAANIIGLPVTVSSGLVFGNPAPGQIILAHTFAFETVFPPNFQDPTSYGTYGVGAELPTICMVMVNGDQVGTITYNDNDSVAFATAGFTVDPGDRMTVVMPDPMDAALTDPAVTLVGTRVS